MNKKMMVCILLLFSLSIHFTAAQYNNDWNYLKYRIVDNNVEFYDKAGKIDGLIYDGRIIKRNVKYKSMTLNKDRMYDPTIFDDDYSDNGIVVIRTEGAIQTPELNDPCYYTVAGSLCRPRDGVETGYWMFNNVVRTSTGQTVYNP